MFKFRKSILAILLAMLSVQVIFLQGYCFDWHVQKALGSSGVAGAGGVSKLGDYSSYVNCVVNKDNKCRIIYDKVKKIELEIQDSDDQITQTINSIKSETLKQLIKDYDKLQKDYDKESGNDELKNAIKEQLDALANKIYQEALLSNPSLETLVKQNNDLTLKHVDMVNNEFKTAFDEWKSSCQNEGNSKNEKHQQEEPKDQTDVKPENNDQTDCSKQSMGQLQDGELIVFGIPGLGGFYIPDGSKQSRKDKNVNEKNINDKTFQNLKSVEQNSEKVTQEEINSLLLELGNSNSCTN